MSDLLLDPQVRNKLVNRILSCLEKAAMDSTACLRGSLAGEKADAYSDIDVLWEIPDAQFMVCVENMEEILSRVLPVESVRSDPSLQLSKKHRLIFVRFVDIPLFWRADIDVCAESIHRDLEFDLNNPAARGSAWSLPESALMNAVRAIKGHLRQDNAEAKLFAATAYDRVGLEVPPLDVRGQILELCEQVQALDPQTRGLAERVKQLAIEAFR